MGSTQDSGDRRSGPSGQQHQQRNRNVQHDVSAEVGKHGRQQAPLPVQPAETTSSELQQGAGQPLADLVQLLADAPPLFVRPSLQSAIEDLGYTFGRAEESLNSRRPTPFERDTLELEPDEWIIQILRTSYSTEGTPVAALETICAASRHIFPIGQVAGVDEF